MSDDSREENVYMAKLAEQAERYDEVSPVESHGARADARSRHSRPHLPRVEVCPGSELDLNRGAGRDGRWWR